MSKYSAKKRAHYLPILVVFFMACNQVSALPFTVTPDPTVPFPTVMTDNSTTFASYIVSNNTASQRNNTYVKYLPPNVAVAAGGCGSQFNLAPIGQPGSSCTLNLAITGTVNSSNTDPANHLFVCFPGGKSCAGTPIPLNISVLTDAGYNFSSITTYGTTVYTGGFNAANDGQVWQLLGNGWNVAYTAQAYSPVESIVAISPNLLYFGGDEHTAGPFASGWVSSFNPITHQAIDTGFASATSSVGVTSVTYGNGVLYAGGQDNPTDGSDPNTTPLTGQIWSYQNGAWSSTGLTSTNDAITNIYVLGYSNAQNRLFAAAANNGVNTASSGGYAQVLYYSNGAWVDTGLPTSDNPPYFVSIYGLVVDASGNVYAGGQDSSYSGAVWKYNGTSWTSLNFPNTSEEVADLAFNSNGILYAGGFDATNYVGQVWYYLNGVWTSTNLRGSLDIYAIAIDSANLLYAVGTYPGGESGIWSINANTGA